MSSDLDLDGFRSAAESLKLYRRADLTDVEDGTSLIEQLYVDPLPQQDVFKTVLRPHTTMVIGRKGTGKSTVFQRLQHELRKTTNSTSAYVDIKTLFESAQPDQALILRLEEYSNALPPDSLERLALYREFLVSVIGQIKVEIGRRIETSIWLRIKEKFTGTLADVQRELDAILGDVTAEKFISVLGIREQKVKESSETEKQSSSDYKIAAKAGAKPTIAADAEQKKSARDKTAGAISYSDILIRVFDIKALISKLKSLLARIGIKHLYVLIDDFSELPEEAMRVVVDTLLAPLNNWSEEFVKFKIAAYPGRVYYGDLDRSKIDEIYLDLYHLFGTSDVTAMEENAIAFTRRLVVERLKHFSTSDPSDFFDQKPEEVWKALYFASMANPRTLGYILHFAYQNHLIHGKRIGLKTVQDAALKYYEEKIASYFITGRFLNEAISERCSIYSLKELLEEIVSRSRELRQHKSGVFDKINGRPPTSHFHTLPLYEPLLSTLELNFFITKYFEMSDRDGRKVSIYALNYGLCQRHTIAFGRPSGEREFRLYFVERVFDFTPIIHGFLERNQEISCDQCGTVQNSSRLEALKLFQMRCPVCSHGTCQIINLSGKYEPMLKEIQSTMLLPHTELGILQTLHSEDEPKRAVFVAAELDCSYQLVGKRAKKLEERGLIKREQDEEGRRVLELTDLAEKSYFSSPEFSELDVKDEKTPE